MARVTVEDALKQAVNRFALVLLTSQRAKQLLKGSHPLVESRHNREIVTALREIAAEKVTYSNPEYLEIVKDNYKLVPNDTEFIGDDDDLE
jgi:DNA-directed RNA polymerase subunit omega